MPATTNPVVNFDWLDYREEWSQTGKNGIATLQTAWADALRFPRAMLGEHKRAGASILRFLPQQFPGRDWHCSDLRMIGGVGAVGSDLIDMIKFREMANGVDVGDGKAKWEAVFKRLPYRVLENNLGAEINRFVERTQTGSVDAAPIPGTSYKFVSDNQVVPEASTLLLPVNAHRYTQYFVPELLPEDAWRAAAGCVNSAIFDPSKLAAPIGTVLFLNVAEREMVEDGNGNICWHITFDLAERPTGWNKFPRKAPAAAGVTFEAVVDENGDSPYASYDLNTLFG